MTAYAFYSNIPAASNYPGNDQPDMLTNNINLPLYLAVDHVPFGTTSNGYHKQVTYASENTPSTPTNPLSIAFTQSATSFSGTVVQNSGNTIAQNFYMNANGLFPLSAVKAFVIFENTTTPHRRNSMNVTSVTYAANVFTITLTNNVVFGNYPVILITGNNSKDTIFWSYTSNVITLNVPAIGNSTYFSVLVLQV